MTTSTGACHGNSTQRPADGVARVFDAFSKALVGKQAEVEAESLDLGDQVVAGWLHLTGITYDSRNDLLDVALDRGPDDHLGHLIRHPKRIIVQEGSAGVESIAIDSGDGVQQIISLRDPLMPPPASAGLS